MKRRYGVTSEHGIGHDKIAIEGGIINDDDCQAERFQIESRSLGERQGVWQQVSRQNGNFIKHNEVGFAGIITAGGYGR